jgi:hypothetical protein
MPVRPLARVISFVIPCVILVAALVLIRVGRQRPAPDSPPVETPPQAVSEPSNQPTETPAPIEPPTQIETPDTRPTVRKPSAPSPSARGSARRPAATTAKSGEARATTDRTEVAAAPPPSLPEPTSDPGRVGEAIEPVAPPPRAVHVPDVREISPGDRVYERESTALAQVLGRYEQAYDRLDATRAAAIWPSVDSRALARAFARLRMQDLDFGNCTFAVSTSDAAARCAGVLRYARRIGDTTLKTEQHIWTIEFARAGEAWRIVRITAQ